VISAEVDKNLIEHGIEWKGSGQCRLDFPAEFDTILEEREVGR
jgi:hypothetical protein